MAIFNSYVKLPEGNLRHLPCVFCLKSEIPMFFVLKSSQVQDVVPLRGRFEAQVRIRLTLHAHGPMLHPWEEGECALDAVGGHLPRSSQNQRRKFRAKDTGRKFSSSSTGTFLRIEKIDENWNFFTLDVETVLASLKKTLKG